MTESTHQTLETRQHELVEQPSSSNCRFRQMSTSSSLPDSRPQRWLRALDSTSRRSKTCVWPWTSSACRSDQ